MTITDDFIVNLMFVIFAIVNVMLTIVRHGTLMVSVFFFGAVGILSNNNHDGC